MDRIFSYTLMHFNYMPTADPWCLNVQSRVHITQNNFFLGLLLIFWFFETFTFCTGCPRKFWMESFCWNLQEIRILIFFFQIEAGCKQTLTICEIFRFFWKIKLTLVYTKMSTEKNFWHESENNFSIFMWPYLSNYSFLASVYFQWKWPLTFSDRLVKPRKVSE